jgi:hypothetical protein
LEADQCSVDGEERIEAGGLEEDGPALAGLSTGFSRFGTFRVRKFLMGRLFLVCRPALAGSGYCARNSSMWAEIEVENR